MAAGRLQAVDVYRGLALLAMAAYHTGWDLNYYHLIEAGIGVDPFWVWAQRLILSAFLVLSGASLTLAHGDGIRWPSFWKREAILAGAAAAVTLGTWLLLGEYLAYFGVLHALVLFSLAALVFVRGPLWIGILVAVGFLFLPAVFRTDLFDPRTLDWIGLFKATPDSADLVPIFPWFGVMLIGVIGMRVLKGAPAFTWSSRAWPVRTLALLGRWSLLFYLIHQPVLFGIITPIANYVSTAEQIKLESFTQSCTASCLPGHEAGFCTRYCGCALEMTVTGNLWDASKPALEAMGKLCTEMSK